MTRFLWMSLGLVAFAGSAQADTSLDSEVEQYLAQNSGKWADPSTFRAYWKTGIKFESGDGNFKAAIGGRLMYDMDWRDSDDNLDPEIGENYTGFRRVRLAVSGTVYKNTVFKIQLDFAKGIVVLKDVFVGLKGVGGQTILFGHQKVPFGLNELTSSKYISFIERAASSVAFAPGRDNGIAWGGPWTESKRLWAKIGIFQATNDLGQASGQGGWGVAFRITGLAIENKDKEMILHLGFNFRWQNYASGEIRYRARPGTGFGPRAVNTDNLAASDDLRWGFELAFRMKSVHFQAEFFQATPSMDSGSDPTFSGWYVQVGWFITGEARKFQQNKNAAWGRTKPKANFWTGDGGKGGLELAVRYDNLDLTDAAVVGGEMTTFTVGFNWYWNPNARVMLDYTFMDLDKAPNGAGDGKLNIVSIRWQFDF